MGHAPRHELADRLVRLTERHPSAHQVLGDIRGQREAVGRRGDEPLATDPHGRNRAGQRGQHQQQGVDRVEDRLLVLLQIAVVGERQSLESGQEAGQIPDEPAGLPPGQLRDVRVLLLRHDRATGREGVVQFDPAELPRRPEHDLLAEPRQVHSDQGRHEQELGGEVPVGDRVEGVGERPVEPQLRGRPLRVERQRGTGQCPGPQGAHRRPGVPVAQPVDVPDERLHVCQQLMTEGDRLGVLQVGHPGGRGIDVLLGKHDQRMGQLGQPRGHLAGRVPQVEPQVGGDLIVAAPAGPQLSAQRSEPFEQTAFEGGVDILVLDGRAEPALGDRVGELVQGGEHRRELVDVEQPGPVQEPGVRLRREQVVGRQPPVELDAYRQPGERLRRAAGEAPAPQPHRRPVPGRPVRRVVPAGRVRRGHGFSRCSRAAQTFVGKPQSSMNPRASRWSNWSPAS